MLERIPGEKDCVSYKIKDEQELKVNRIISSTIETRSICNDSMVMGFEYTQKLQTACSKIIKDLQYSGVIHLEEKKTTVYNILRGGLNFGLREALVQAFKWNLHGSSFVSAQRARKNPDSEEWKIIESEYKKIYLPPSAHIVIGDVVATGTSLIYGLKALIAQAEASHTMLESILFFTFGGIRTEELLEEIDALCREKFPNYQSTTLCYLEGRFTVPSPSTPITLKITGTDLLKYKALMAPEFIESQYDHPSYPLERCIIYDAGSRAFWLPDYLEDVIDYWEQMQVLAHRGINFEQELNERTPHLNFDRFDKTKLEELAVNQIAKLKELL
jgi:uracil phosphoribosyltransferase